MRCPRVASLFYLLCGILCALRVDADDANDLVTCGGFVEASSNLAPLIKQKLDYSFVQMHLFTSEGLLKYSTECAPNGYYFIPVYDQGSYYLQIEGPDGWTFEPERVPFVVNSQEQGCSDDINFKFTGFTLAAQIVGGRTDDCTANANGPSGVTLTLHNSGGDKIATLTSTDGKAVFSNVFPDNYTVVASHDKWQVVPREVKVELGFGNAKLGTPFSVTGYGVSGSLQASEDAVADVDVFLYSKTKKSVKCSGAAKGTPLPDVEGHLLCATKSNKDGKYSFAHIPCGHYTVVPHYKREHTSFDVVPKLAEVVVDQGDLTVPTFEVKGFSVSGRVLDRKGKGVAGAQVLLNGEVRATSGKDGSYHIEQVTAGQYSVKAVREHTFFHELKKVVLSPAKSRISDITVIRYHVCGRVDTGEHVGERKVVLTNVKFNQQLTATADGDGNFCFQVVPGKYVVKPEVADSERAKGILLSPSQREVVVSDRPILDAHFSQTRVSVSGTVKCISSCGTDVEIELAHSSNPDASRSVNLEKDGSFEFPAVSPGTYTVTVSRQGWCWTEQSKEVAVDYEDVSGVSFQQSGYRVEVDQSHAFKFKFSRVKGGKKQKTETYDFKKGRNGFCVADAGTYELQPVSCYRFAEESFTFDTASPTVLELHAEEYEVFGYVAVLNGQPKGLKKRPEHVELQLLSAGLNDPDFDSQEDSGDDDNSQRLQAALVPDSVAAELLKADPQKNPEAVVLPKDLDRSKVWLYKYSFWSSEDQQFRIGASPIRVDDKDGKPTGSVLFYPRFTVVAVDGKSCPPTATTLVGKPGLFLTGVVEPAVPNVVVTITSDHTSDLKVRTNAAGEYRAGPLYDDQKYSVSAEAAGYHLVDKKGVPGSFVALKLGQLAISITDQNGAPLKGVLLSLSGQKYRRNNQTDEDGRFIFRGLFPGQYFLRPLLKEYTFQPKSLRINVEQASSEEYKFTADRVAFSVFGSVRSLNGQSESNVVIEAFSDAQGKHKHPRVEETTSDDQGQFRLRGLFPDRTYEVRIKSTGLRKGSKNEKIERAAPAFVSLDMKREDVRGVHFIVFHHLSKFDLTGRVNITSLSGPAIAKDLLQAWYKDVKVELYQDSSPGSPVKVASVSYAMPFFEFHALPADRYHIKLRTITSTRAYSFATHEVPVDLHSHVHVQPVLVAQMKHVAPELSQGSFLSLVIAMGIGFVFFNREQFISNLTGIVSRSRSSGALSSSQSTTSSGGSSRRKKKR